MREGKRVGGGGGGTLLGGGTKCCINCNLHDCLQGVHFGIKSWLILQNSIQLTVQLLL